MELMGNKQYRIGVIINRELDGYRGKSYFGLHKRPYRPRLIAYVNAVYAGGSVVDENGNHIGGGCWYIGGKPYWDLNVITIENTPYQEWDPPAVRESLLLEIKLKEREEAVNKAYRKWQVKSKPYKNKNAERFWSNFVCGQPLKCDECGDIVSHARCSCNELNSMYSEWSY